jgi:phosphodiesterase/alkaline phosphatase D-like protein
VPGTLYNYRVKSKDAAGNLATSQNFTFTTTAADTTAPTISAVQASNVASSGATVTWTTNEASDTQVEYGTTTAYGSSTTLDANPVTAHSVALSGLTANTLYHYRVKSRDAAGNLATSQDFTFTTAANPAPPTCPCSIWPSTATPQIAAENDANPIEVGVKFRANVDGYITGIRFYKGAGNSGTHTGSLWSSTGTRLATATFTSETASGWQQVSFATAVPVTANTTYTASYYAPAGRYAKNVNGLATAVTNGPLTALASGTSGGNGVYRYGAPGGFPTASWMATNYWVDVVFTTTPPPPDTTAPTISAVQATGISGTGATITWTTDEASDSQVEYGTTTSYGSSTTLDTNPVTAHSVQLTGLMPGTLYHYRVKSKDAAGNLATSQNFTFTTTAADTTAPTISAVQASNVASSGATITWTTDEASDTQVEYGTTTAYGSSTTLNPSPVTSHSVTLSGLTAGTLYHYRVKSKDAAGNLATSQDFTFTTASLTCPCSIWPSTAAPVNPAQSDTSAIEVGVKFQANTNGYITGVRFYKGAGNTGTHTGSLWSATGTRLATATFTNETASGWQQVSFATPVQITANTTYVASYFAPVGRYPADANGLTAAVTNGPLTALASGTSGGNGVYRYGAPGGFPTASWMATNYWVDVVFTTTPPPPDTTAPTISAVQATANSSSVATVTWATDEPADSQVEYGPTTAYGSSTTIDPNLVTAHSVQLTGLMPETLYHYRVKSKDGAGNLATSQDFTFTTPPLPVCPCSIWNDSTTPQVPTQNDANAIEVGVKFQANTNGYVIGIRFYKGAGNSGTHTGSLWSSTGTRLATATFANETASGWQQVSFANPVQISANTTYVASYFAPVGRYATSNSFFAGGGVTNGPLRALSNAEAGGNGVYRYGSTSGFPTSTFNSENYWVDVLFSATLDTTAPAVSSVTPTNGATDVPQNATVSVTFSEPMDPSSLNTTTFELRDSGNSLVPATIAYNSATRTATLTPSGPLPIAMTYTVTVKGGTSGARATDVFANALAASFTSTFTTVIPPDGGSGGPILVVVSDTNKFSRYYEEILKAEGLNSFTVADILTVTAAKLASHDVVLLGELPLTTAQVTLFTDWVTAGGNLIAMRPDAKLAGLLGLSAPSGTRADAYLLVNTASGPGAGIVNQTIQYHGTADLYSLSGATSVATLYANATTVTSNPAVTLRSVGTAGGQAAAFTYDLARSVVYTRQGNPAWVGQERDGIAPVRSDDLFFGGAQADWVDLDKVAIPQADEQQRLLANLILSMNSDRKPLPRFWYLPNGKRAAVVMTGDDHASGGTAGRFDHHKAISPPGCVVANWECIRSTSYIYPGSPLTNAQAAAYTADGFEVSIHITTGCANYTAGSLASNYAGQIAEFRADYSSIPSPRTHRLHCLVWSDWASQAQVELSNGIRLDTNYYYYPPSWAGNQPGLMTGSGMPMRFAGLDGSTIDVYQAATQMTDESGQSYPSTINALLDKAVGPEGYYGAFVANMHTDDVPSAGSDAIVAAAQARGVPVVSAQQMLTWLDGRNGSAFGAVAWSGNDLTFTVTTAAGANGLQAMIPTVSSKGTLTSVTRNGSPVAVTTETIKGVQYAVFPTTAGAYAVRYN